MSIDLPEDLRKIFAREVKVPISRHKDVTYISIKQLPISEELKSEFAGWMNGQTRPLIPGVPDAVYAHDFDYWCMTKAGRPVPFD